MWLQKPAPDETKNKAALIRVYRQAVAQGLSLEELNQKVKRYVQRQVVTREVEDHDEELYEQQLFANNPLAVRILARSLPVILLLIGVLLISSALLPITSTYILGTIKFERENFLSPVPYEDILESRIVVAAAQTSDERVLGQEIIESSSPQIIETAFDYTNLNNWLPAELELDQESEPDSDVYRLDIPEIEIENAVVRIGGSDLGANLIQYPGTALPGQLGAPVIFGHSVLRQFYNPSEDNPKRYNSIFSYIMTLKPGDKIYLTQGEFKYTYEVIRKTEVKPEDTYILSQKYDARLLKLVTCTPEGTYLRRGVVTAQLVE